jgi:hypothetical protein
MAADMKRLDARIKTAIVAAAIDGAHAIEPELPVAFGDLRRSLRVDAVNYLEGHVRIVLGAPHAAAIEVGSRPHVVPLEALIAWVKLRGMQGLTKHGDLITSGKKSWGKTTTIAAIGVAQEIRRISGDYGGDGGGVTPVDAPTQIARAIQASIAKHGTKPHWPVRRSLPKIKAALATRMRNAVKGP